MDKVVKKKMVDRKTQEKQEILKVLFTLMAQGNKSERAISKDLGITHTTLSRRIRKLEQEGYIQEYTAIPNLHKLGIDILVFTFVSSADAVTPAPGEFHVWAEKYPAILCFLQDEGLGATNFVIVSMHRNYEEYVELFKKLQKDAILMKNILQNVKVNSFVFRTGREFPKPFSLRNFGKFFEPTE